LSQTVGILLFIVAILVTIVIHEAAHFGTAKWFGIKVEEFFVGFGPRLWSVRKGETEYGVKALPLGGYVRIAGMNPYQPPSPEDYPRTFGAKPAWQRTVVIAAGPATHFLIALVLFIIYFGTIGQIAAVAPRIGAVDPKLNGHVSPAMAAGLQPGDEVLRVDDIARPSSDRLVTYTRRHVGVPVTLVVQRGDRRFTVQVTPELAKVEDERVGRIGVLLTAGEVLSRDRKDFTGAVAAGAGAVGTTTVESFKSLGRTFGPQGLGRISDLLFGGADREPTDPTSVVGAARVAGQATRAGALEALLLILANINVFVGILNFLPLPPFDGGHLAVIALEKIRGRKVDMRKLMPITAVVAIYLVIWFMSITYLDIVKPLPDLFR
jgi:membrane-associated protease RseP (regulator of RpoE activity)